jgi:arylformamidase
LSKEAAIYLRECGVMLVGIDSLNNDYTSDGKRPAHSILLEADISIAEHLTALDQLPDESFRFFAVRVKAKDFGSFPVRPFGLVANTTTSDI